MYLKKENLYIYIYQLNKMKEKYIKKAIDLSINKINLGHGPFGAVIVKDNEIVGQGVNSVVLHQDPSAHAEIMAIRDACKKLNTHVLDNCDIYSSCEPCSMCYSAIKWARINKIYYSNTRDDVDKIGFSDKSIYDSIEKKKTNMIRIENNTAINAFSIWNNSQKKILY